MAITAEEAKRLSQKCKFNPPSAFDQQLTFICQRIEKSALRGFEKAQFLPTEFSPALLPETKQWLESKGFEVETFGTVTIISWVKTLV